MLALVNTPSAQLPVQLREFDEPVAAADEAIVEVHAFSLNRGELALLASRPEGWRPGQDIAGVVKAAADGSEPKEGTRVVALVDGAGWSQRVAAPTARMAALPDNVSFASHESYYSKIYTMPLHNFRYGIGAHCSSMDALLIPCLCEARQSNHADYCCSDMHEDVRFDNDDREPCREEQEVWNEGKQQRDPSNPAIQGNRAC